MGNKEVEINGKKFGETSKITMSISTLLYIICGLFTIISTFATIGYFDIKKDVKNQKLIFDNGKIEYKDDIKNILQKELRYEREKREEIIKVIGEIKGDIKVILEKTRNIENHSLNNNAGFLIPDTTYANFN